ncbi:MAG: S8 family serine peptidase [Cocleimonas sp.]|nr:S8 family serine peptidase [Cocleimonas sp.]
MNTKPVSNNNPFIRLLISSAVVISVAGCGGGGSNTTNPTSNTININSTLNNIEEVNRLRYFKEINVGQARTNFNLTGKGVTVTIMGEIADASHPDLKNRIVKQFNTYSQKGTVITGDGNQPYKLELFGAEGEGHGTHIAGTIAAECDNKGVQGVACEANLEVYDIGTYMNKAIPQQGWGEAEGLERLIVAFSTALDDVSQRRSSRILTGSFNIESPTIIYKAGGEIENLSITQMFKRFEQDVESVNDLSDKGLVTFQNDADKGYLERIFNNNNQDPTIIAGTVLPKSKQWKELETAIKAYQDTDGVYIITESNNIFENRTSVLNAMPSLSDKVDPDLWISAVLVQPKPYSETGIAVLESEVDLAGEYITPINSCGELAQSYCILIPSYDVLSTMTEALAFNRPIYQLNNRNHQILTGHSMGAPMIAGALALMEEYNVRENTGYKMKDLVRILKENAHKSFLGYDAKKHGNGLLDIEAALNAM